MKQRFYAFNSFDEFDRLTNEIVGPALAPFGFAQASVEKGRGYYAKVYAICDQRIRVYTEWTGFTEVFYQSSRCVGATARLLLKLLGRKQQPPEFKSGLRDLNALQDQIALFTQELADVLDGTLDYKVTKQDLADLMVNWKAISVRLANDIASRLEPSGYRPHSVSDDGCDLVRDYNQGRITFHLGYAIRYLGIEITPTVRVAVKDVESFIKGTFSEGRAVDTRPDTVSVWMYELEGQPNRRMWMEDEKDYHTKVEVIFDEYHRLGEPFALSLFDLSTLYAFLTTHSMFGLLKDAHQPEPETLRAIYVGCLLGRYEEARAAIAELKRLRATVTTNEASLPYWLSWDQNFSRYLAALSDRFPKLGGTT